MGSFSVAVGSQGTQFLAGVGRAHKKKPQISKTQFCATTAKRSTQRSCANPKESNYRKAIGSQGTQFLAGVGRAHEKKAPNKQNIVLRYHRKAVNATQLRQRLVKASYACATTAKRFTPQGVITKQYKKREILKTQERNRYGIER